MRDSSTHLFSTRLFLIALAFGAAALLVIVGSFHLQIPGTNIVTDPREIFVTIGAALTGPAGAVVIGILAGLGDPNPELHLYIVVMHIVGALWVGWAYKRLIHDRIRMPWMLGGWVGVVFVYYYVCSVPVVAAAKYFFPDFFLRIIPEPQSLWSTLMLFYRGWTTEFILTSALTSAVLLVLPRQARAPMWWTAGHPRVVASMRERPPRSILALRLTVWFLILSCMPLVIMAIFLRTTLTRLYVEQIAKDELDVLSVLVRTAGTEEHLKELVDVLHPAQMNSLHARFILDDVGRIVWTGDSTHRYADARGVYGRAVVDTILHTPRGYYYDEGNRRCFMFYAYDGGRRTLVILLDADLGTATLKSFERSTLIRLGLALVIVSVIAGLVIRVIIGRPIRALADAARRVGRNDLHARVDPQLMSDEVGILGEAFNEMAENLSILHDGLQTEIQDRRATEQALRKSERRFRELSELLPQTVYEVDMGGRLLFANKVAFTMFGLEERREEPVISVFDFIAPTDRERARTAFGNLFDGKGTPGNEYLLQRADGRTFPGLVYSSVVREGSRAVGLCGIIVDISEQRRVQQVLEASVAEKEVLLKEIHHRVKNNLQIISSLLNLQSTAIRDPLDLALFTESVDRIRSMALIHDRLYKSQDFAGIEFRDYIESLIVSLFHSYGHPDIEYRADVRDVLLSIDMAIPCGLIINELVTNALKHAFPDRRRGMIAVSLHTRDNGDVELLVADDGIGLPENADLSNVSSLGLHLVKILTDQLEGTLEIRRGNGTTFCVLVPRPPERTAPAPSPDAAQPEGESA
jgi:PAS domain S-box-containing protein